MHISQKDKIRGWAAQDSNAYVCLPIFPDRVCAIRAALWYSPVLKDHTEILYMNDMHSAIALNAFEKKKWRVIQKRGWKIIMVDIAPISQY